MKRTIFFNLLFCLCINFAACFNDSDGKKTDNIDFSNLNSIEINLAWRQSKTRAVAPENQEHYIQQLVINHETKTIKDSYKYYRGIDSSSMTTSEIDRSEKIYNKFENYLSENEVIQLKEIENNDCAGPTDEYIIFKYNDNSEVKAYFKSDFHCLSENYYELVSQEFSKFLNDLKTDH